MANEDRYLDFMEEETNLSNQERLSYGDIKEVSQMVEMLNSKDTPENIEAYILKNVQVLFNYAPHLTIQIYLALFAARNMNYVVLEKLEALLTKPDLPAKSYSVVNSYISILKNKETLPPYASFASDDKIKETVDNISPQKISRLVFAMQVRLETGTDMNHFVELLNPFMMSPVKDPIYKISLVQQLALLAKKKPATIPLTIYIDGSTYTITLDNTYDPSIDAFIRTVSFYADSLSLKGNLRDLLLSFAQMYRVLHYNEKYVLNTEADIKSFCCCLIQAYNDNISSFSPSSVFKIEYPETYKNEKGWKEASKFLNVAFRPRYL